MEFNVITRTCPNPWRILLNLFIYLFIHETNTTKYRRIKFKAKIKRKLPPTLRD